MTKKEQINHLIAFTNSFKNHIDCEQIVGLIRFILFPMLSQNLKEKSMIYEALKKGQAIEEKEIKEKFEENPNLSFADLLHTGITIIKTALQESNNLINRRSTKTTYHTS